MQNTLILGKIFWAKSRPPPQYSASRTHGQKGSPPLRPRGHMISDSTPFQKIIYCTVVTVVNPCTDLVSKRTFNNNNNRNIVKLTEFRGAVVGHVPADAGDDGCLVGHPDAQSIRANCADALRVRIPRKPVRLQDLDNAQ